MMSQMMMAGRVQPVYSAMRGMYVLTFAGHEHTPLASITTVREHETLEGAIERLHHALMEIETNLDGGHHAESGVRDVG